jgi:hypothetical protein
MSHRERPHDTPAMVDELAAARRLAEAIEARATGDVDREALAVVHLLDTVSGIPGDEVAHRRLRLELVRRGARSSFAVATWRRVAAAAAVVGAAALSLFLWRSPSRPGEDRLAEREQAARSAVAPLAASWDSDAAATERIVAALAGEWRTRLDNELRRERFAALGTRDGDAATPHGVRAQAQPTRAVPIPGGVS